MCQVCARAKGRLEVSSMAALRSSPKHPVILSISDLRDVGAEWGRFAMG